MSKKLTFNAEEYTKMSVVADKLFRARAKLSDKEWSRGNNPIVKEIYKKFSLQAATHQANDVFLKRSHLRFIEEACKQSIEVLTTKIIPAYKARGEEEYKDYINKAETNSNVYTSILQKVQKAL